MSVWVAVLVGGAASYQLRVLPLLIGERVHLSDRTQAGLRHAGMGAITALLVLGILATLRPAAGLPVPAVVVALVVAVACAWLGRSMLTTVLVGAGAYASVALLIAVGGH
ncbi:AzlD domain-containing protein [Intrasporangium sp. DVR]|uniref:AzlD domain-containing protein n=1 Tax=Intrasporangium sp. DVR TaxID=3127867 RepID=UPI00313A52B0